MQNSKFFSLLKFAASAQATKDIRWYLNGVCLDFAGDKLTFVGTDGHRMAIVSQSFDSGFTGRFIVSSDSVKKVSMLFAKSSGDVVIEVQERSLTINGYKVELVDGTYPDYKRVDVTSPAPGERQAVGFKPEYIMDAAKALGALNKKGLRVNLQGELSSGVLSTLMDDGTEARIVIMPIRT